MIYTWSLITWPHVLEEYMETIWGKKKLLDSFPLRLAQTNFVSGLFHFSKFAPFFPRKMRQTEHKAVKKKQEKRERKKKWSVARALPRPFARSAMKISSPLLKISKPCPSAVMSSTSSLSLSLSLRIYAWIKKWNVRIWNWWFCLKIDEIESILFIVNGINH